MEMTAAVSLEVMQWKQARATFPRKLGVWLNLLLAARKSRYQSM